MYAKYLPHIGNDYEFAEMLAEMLGELNISHSGARWAASGADDDATASLGVILDQTYAGSGREDRRGTSQRAARNGGHGRRGRA